MHAERRMGEAVQHLHDFVAARPIPAAPAAHPAPARRVVAVGFALAAAAIIVVVGAVLLADDRVDDAVVAPGDVPALILPLDEIDRWTYEVTDVTNGARLDDVTVVPASSGMVADPTGTVEWPIPLLEPWRAPARCEGRDPLLLRSTLTLPTLAELDSAGSYRKEVRDTCDGIDLVGAARVSWDDSEPITVPAGTYDAVRIELAITGFQNPFPVTVSLWVDPSVGVVRHEAVGSAPGPERHVRADLVSFE